MAVRGLVLLVAFAAVISGVFSYTRPRRRETLSISLPADQDSTTPEQAHVSVVGEDKMRISWTTKDSSPTTVEYGTSPGQYDSSANGTTTSYKILLYKSGQIHDVVIGPLNPSTAYYYRCGLNTSREFNFTTTPAQLPIKFVVVGDLGQTGWTQSTLEHIGQSNYDMLLLPGDLSYADLWEPRWDSYGRLVEPLASQRPWMVTQGNHEVETILLGKPTPFLAYNHRWRMPFEESGSTSNLYYSFNVAGVHVIMLGSYTDFDHNSAQYKWLEGDLKSIDRNKTPWVFALVHAPWYNTNFAHQGEKQSVGMKASMEDLLYENLVDVVFAGHVHAYERFTRVYQDQANNCAPVYITIGDGGNREGLATKYMEPQPKISIFREASFGHGELEIVNATHALWTWHRNDDDESVIADSVWLNSLASNSACGSS
ncbi:Probable purple acid phosphatase 20 [Ancistrocladus abbreviatus]